MINDDASHGTWNMECRALYNKINNNHDYYIIETENEWQRWVISILLIVHVVCRHTVRLGGWNICCCCCCNIWKDACWNCIDVQIIMINRNISKINKSIIIIWCQRVNALMEFERLWTVSVSTIDVGHRGHHKRAFSTSAFIQQSIIIIIIDEHQNL